MLSFTYVFNPYIRTDIVSADQVQSPDTHHSLARHQVVDESDGLPTWKVAQNVAIISGGHITRGGPQAWSLGEVLIKSPH